QPRNAAASTWRGVGAPETARRRVAKTTCMEGLSMSTVPAALVEAVAKAVEKLSRPGIEGWGLRVSGDMEDAGDVVDLGEHIGCVDECCAHVSHDPAAPRRRWVPRSGRIVELGSDEEPGEVIVRWFAHLGDDGSVRYIRLDEPRLFHPAAQSVTSVPDRALARPAQGAAV